MPTIPNETKIMDAMYRPERSPTYIKNTMIGGGNTNPPPSKPINTTSTNFESSMRSAPLSFLVNVSAPLRFAVMAGILYSGYRIGKEAGRQISSGGVGGSIAALVTHTPLHSQKNLTSKRQTYYHMRTDCQDDSYKIVFDYGWIITRFCIMNHSIYPIRSQYS